MLNVPAHALEPDEGAVSFVAVKKIGFNANSIEGTDTANAEQQFLLQPVLVITPI